jgi:undecaprenyl-diphosphatase
MANHPQTASHVFPSQSRLTVLLASGVGVLVLTLVLIGSIRSDMWQVVILGIVEGVTEFLPISSTGHLLMAAKVLKFQNSIGGTFEIFIQLGAVLAVISFYARDLLGQARALPTSVSIRRFWLGIVLAFLPAAVVGIVLRTWIKQVLFTSPTVIAAALIVGGVVLIVVERLPQPATATRDVEQISLRQALAIGMAQVFALIPGVSRAGASIVGGRLGGLDRRTATAFSFYLAIPTLGAATMVDLLGSLDQLVPDDLVRLLVGTVVAFVVAWISIGWLLRYVANHSFVVFGSYRIALGLAILLLGALGWL